jgi:hypothetical protein
VIRAVIGRDLAVKNLDILKNVDIYRSERKRVMKKCVIDEGVVVHPMGGMQLSEGYIREDQTVHFKGCLPGMEPSAGDTVEEVLSLLCRKAKAFYGDDVIVEIAHSH